MIRKINSFKNIFLNFGLYGVFEYSLKNLGIIDKNKIEERYNNRTIPKLNNLRIDINNKLFKLLKNKIFYGPYKNIKLVNDFSHKKSNRSSQILGSYELQIQKKSIFFKNKYKLKNLVNFGSENGFHVLGLIKNFRFSKAICFEIKAESRNTLSKNLKINKISNKVKIFGKASFTKTFEILNNQDLKKTLFIIDIEGEEYNLLNKDIISKLNKSCLIIENHDFAMKNKEKVKIIIKNLKKNFNISFIKTEFPRLENYINKIKMSQDELILSLFEDRKEMNWIICEPK